MVILYLKVNLNEMRIKVKAFPIQTLNENYLNEKLFG